jgi:outer membrane protein
MAASSLRLRVRVAIALLVVPRLASAEPMHLQDVLAQAVRSNPQLLQARVDVDTALAAVETAAGLDDFLLDGSGVFIANQQRLIEGAPVQTPSAREIDGELDLTKPFASGGSLGLRALTSWSSTDFLTDLGMGPVTSTSIAYVPSLQLVLKQPLLRGAGARVARAPQRRARESLDAAALARRAVAATVVRDVASAYYELVFASADRDIRRQLAAAARDQLRRVRANIDAGKLPPSASAEVEVAVGARDEDALVAEQTVLERSLTLRQIAGLPIGPDAAGIEALDGIDADLAVPAPADTLARALERSPDLGRVRALGRVATIDVEVTDNGVLPQLDFSIAGGPSGNAPDFGDAVSQVSSFESWRVTAQLAYHDTLGRNAVHGARSAARAARQRALVSEKDLTAQIAVAVVRLTAAANEARQRVQVITPTTDSAKLDLDAERARFEVGRSTNFDVLRRQDELAQTQLRQARARIDFLQAMTALQAVTGDVLERFGVALR